MSILFVPSVWRGNGSGHLARCFAMASGIQTSKTTSVCIYIKPPANNSDKFFTLDTVRLAYPREAETLEMVDILAPGRRFRLVVLDQRFSTMKEIDQWSAYGTVVAIDEGGIARPYIPYILDLLPQPVKRGYFGRQYGMVNQLVPGLLPLPETRKKTATLPVAIKSVLISFGGEDKAGLAEKFLDTVYQEHLLGQAKLTLVSGPLATENMSVRKGMAPDEPGQSVAKRITAEQLAAKPSNTRWPGLVCLSKVQNLREYLHKYDLVITHFGLTAYEAAWAGCAVLLFNPSRLHEHLAGQAGFASIGYRTVKINNLKKQLADIPALVGRSRSVAPQQKIDPARFFAELQPTHSRFCQGCNQHQSVAVFRNERKTYLKCPVCGLVSMSYFRQHKNPYIDTAYFFEQYKTQYGRTYLEDLPKLRTMARARLARIERLLGRPCESAAVLDVGCAYGAFVLEAQSRGWSAVGSDVSEAAVDYVKRQCNVPAIVADFALPAADGLYPRQLDCLTMWYVIEHFEELGRVLRRVHNLLKEDGVFAFSTPSGHGISWLARRNSFFENSPDDHYTIWNPGHAARVLQYFGFRVKKIVITGHHPERFPGVPNQVSSWRYRFFMAISRLFRLGDTFECYAVKDSSLAIPLKPGEAYNK